MSRGIDCGAATVDFLSFGPGLSQVWTYHTYIIQQISNLRPSGQVSDVVQVFVYTEQLEVEDKYQH